MSSACIAQHSTHTPRKNKRSSKYVNVVNRSCATLLQDKRKIDKQSHERVYWRETKWLKLFLYIDYYAVRIDHINIFRTPFVLSGRMSAVLDRKTNDSQ